MGQHHPFRCSILGAEMVVWMVGKIVQSSSFGMITAAFQRNSLGAVIVVGMVGKIGRSSSLGSMMAVGMVGEIDRSSGGGASRSGDRSGGKIGIGASRIGVRSGGAMICHGRTTTRGATVGRRPVDAGQCRRFGFARVRPSIANGLNMSIVGIVYRPEGSVKKEMLVMLTTYITRCCLICNPLSYSRIGIPCGRELFVNFDILGKG